MGVDRGITSGTGQVLVLTVRNVEVSLGVTVLLRQTKVDHIDLVAALADAHQEVVRLDITVDEGLGVDVLNAGDELVGKEQDRLERELAVAEVEQILERRTKQVQNHGVVVALGAKPADEGNANTAGKGLVDACFILQLRVLSLDALELDGNLLARDDVGACGGSAGGREINTLRKTYPGRYHRNYRYRSCGRFCTCCRRGDPACLSAPALPIPWAVSGGVARTIVVMFAGGQPGGGWPAVAVGGCGGLCRGAVEPRW